MHARSRSAQRLRDADRSEWREGTPEALHSAPARSSPFAEGKQPILRLVPCKLGFNLRDCSPLKENIP